jgi:hypothetical protein
MDRMRFGFGLAAALGLCIALAAPAASPAQAQQHVSAPKKHSAAGKKRQRLTVTRWRGYGFLPGYRQPDLNDTRPRKTYHYWQGYDWDGFPVGSWGTGGYGGMWYRGRFTNGIGPCWTRTPIGPMWNCG